MKSQRGGRGKRRGGYATFWSESRIQAGIEDLRAHRAPIMSIAAKHHVTVTALLERYTATYGHPPDRRQYIRDPKVYIVSEDYDGRLGRYAEDHRARSLAFARLDFRKFAYDLAESMDVVSKHKSLFDKERKTCTAKFFRYFTEKYKDVLATLQTRDGGAHGKEKERKIEEFYTAYEELIQTFKIHPSRIYCCTVPLAPVVFYKEKLARNMSVLIGINAAGDSVVPPLFAYPEGQAPTTLPPDAPEGSLFRVNRTGIISCDGVLDWMRLIVERTKPTAVNPLILLVDPRSYTRSLILDTYTRENHIYLFGIPEPGMDPLEQEEAKPYREAYNSACCAWLLESKLVNLSEIIKDQTFAPMAFKSAGLWIVEIKEEPDEKFTLDNDMEMLCNENKVE